MPAPVAPRPSVAGESGWSDLAFVLTAVALALSSLVGTAVLVLAGLGEIVQFLGGTATPEEVAASRRLFAAAAGVATAIPLVGLALCFWLRHRRSGILFAVLLLIGTVFAALVAFDVDRSRPAEPVERGPRVCQEHSGSDNRCPGG